MRELTTENITDAVLDQMSTTTDARLKEIQTAAVKHLHAFAKDVNLTPAEWIAGIEFMTGDAGIAVKRHLPEVSADVRPADPNAMHTHQNFPRSGVSWLRNGDSLELTGLFQKDRFHRRWSCVRRVRNTCAYFYGVNFDLSAIKKRIRAITFGGCLPDWYTEQETTETLRRGLACSGTGVRLAR